MLQRKRVDLSLMGEECKRHDFVMKDFNTFCMIILFTMEENIFVAIIYKLFVQNKCFKIALKLMEMKGLRYLKRQMR